MEGAIHQAVNTFAMALFAGSFVILAVVAIIVFGYEMQSKRRVP